MGFISRWNVEDQAALSGMPAAMWQALRRQGLELVQLNSEPLAENPSPWVKRGRIHPVLSPLAVSYRGTKRLLRAIGELASRPFEGRRFLARAKIRSRNVMQELNGHSVDALFGACISTELFELDTRLPIVYFSDATAQLVNRTYPEYARKSAVYHDACNIVERNSLHRATANLFASQCTLESAIGDYGVPREKAWLVPMGGTVVPPAPIEPEVIDPPSSDHVELIIVASDPLRKRLDFAIDVVEELARRGLGAHLNFIGPPTRRARQSHQVRCHGQFRLSDPVDRSKHIQLLRGSHLMVLPSSGEMYGIAPCEAAHFGRPSLVSDAGGLPTVVLHDRTGIVFPLAAGPEIYADAIVALCEDKDRYRAMSRAALCRARSVLNWDAWGCATASHIRRIVSESRSVSRGA